MEALHESLMYLVCSPIGLHIQAVPFDGKDMAKSATVRARVEPQLKEEAESVLQALGLNPTAAITLYYEQIVRRGGIPFELALPNATTRKAMRSAERGRVIRAHDADDLLARLNVDE